MEYTYDNQGNLLSDKKGTYTYDAFNRMEKAELADGQTQVNRYDAEGLRHELEENGKLVQFLYKNKEVVVETEEDGNTIRYIRGLGLIRSDSEKAKTYYHYACDELGNITHVVTGFKREQTEAENFSVQNSGNETAQILNRYEYDAFGNTTHCEENIENRFRFTGQQYDTIIGQYYLRARFYNPVIGPFLQEDNYYGDGLNLYAYCRNNLVKYVDPSGHEAKSAADKNQGGDNQLTPDQQALQDIVDEQNQNGGHDSSDQEIIKEWADQYDMDYDELGVQPKSESGRYSIDDDLRTHIENVDTSVPRKRGIGGAHNKDVFMQNDVQIISQTPHSQIQGVEIIEYQMPKLDRTGTLIPGEYQTGTPKVKTVYDPNVISTNEYLQRGIEVRMNKDFRIYDHELLSDAHFHVKVLFDMVQDWHFKDIIKSISYNKGFGENYGACAFWDDLDDYDKQNTPIYKGAEFGLHSGEEVIIGLKEILYGGYM